MPVRLDPRIQTLVNVGAAVTKVAAQVAPAPLKPLLQAGASGFETARRVLVNLDGGLPPPIFTGGVPTTAQKSATPQEPYRVTITEHRDGDVNFRSSAGGTIVGALPAGTELVVTGAPVRSGGREWMPVQTPDGRQGWIASERTQYLSGTATAYPYVLEDGRDGSGSTAVDHSLKFVSAGERAELQAMYDAMPAGPNRDALGALLERTPEGNTTNWGTGYSNNCLGFVNDDFGISQAMDRSPQMSNPSAYIRAEQTVPAPVDPANPERTLEGWERPVLPEGQIYADLTASAYGAWLGLVNESQAHPENPPLYTAATMGADGKPVLTQPLDEGTILFFGPSTANGNAGHVCIATGVMAPDGTPLVVTSGWPNSQGVKVMSLAEMQAATGTYLGHTTPEQGFQTGRWGGGDHP